MPGSKKSGAACRNARQEANRLSAVRGPDEESGIMRGERDLSNIFEAVVRRRYRRGLRLSARRPILRAQGRNESLQKARYPGRRGTCCGCSNGGNQRQGRKRGLKKLPESSLSPEVIVADGGYRQVCATADLEAIVDRVLRENPSAVANFRKGAGKAMGFLMGQAMQASGGKAHPRALKEIFEEKLR